jgi:hypothetical protein
VLSNSFALGYSPACWAAVANTSWVYLCNHVNTTIDLWLVDAATSAWTYQAAFGPTDGTDCVPFPQALYVSSDASILWIVPSVSTQEGSCFSENVQYAAINGTNGHLEGFSLDGSYSISNQGTTFTSIADDGVLGVWMLDTAGEDLIEEFAQWNPAASSGHTAQQVTTSQASATTFQDGGFYARSYFYALLQQSQPTLRTYPIAASTLNPSGLSDDPLINTALSALSKMFVDVRQASVVVAGLNGASSYAINTASGTTSYTTSTVSTSGAWQCLPAYSFATGFLYNLIDGVIYEYRGATALPPPVSLLAPSPAPPTSTLCGLLMVANSSLVSFLSADRGTVSTYQIT